MVRALRCPIPRSSGSSERGRREEGGRLPVYFYLVDEEVAYVLNNAVVGEEGHDIGKRHPRKAFYEWMEMAYTAHPTTSFRA